MSKKQKQTDESKAFESKLRAMAPGSKLAMTRGEGEDRCVITFTRNEHDVMHSYGRGAMHYTVGFRACADWFTAHDGGGEWREQS